MEQILHLFITNKCRHNCELCCNKFYEIDKIPVVTVELLKSIDTLCLTGGEPFNLNAYLLQFINRIRSQYKNIKNIYIYGSGVEAYQTINCHASLDEIINGVNIAPKDWKDWEAFAKLTELKSGPLYNKKFSNRLYIFPEQRPIFEAMKLDLNKVNIQVIYRVWDKVFNTPKNEHFARLPILY